MNSKLYKLIFSRRLNALVVVGENSVAHSKSMSSSIISYDLNDKNIKFVDSFVGALSLGFICVTSAFADPVGDALPVGGSVSQGSASIDQQANQMIIQQLTDKAVINWREFDIGADANINVIQPNSSSVLLNRVVGNNPSRIFGSLTANGQVVLVNPNGIVFGQDGSVSASAFTASTLGISDEDFMSGNYRYLANDSQGKILNQGTIASKGGYVALLGASVTNDGKIVTQQGNVYMGSAKAITMPISNSGRIRMELDPSSINAAVVNTENGVILTSGGQVLLQASALNDALATASVTHAGTIDTQAAQGGNVSILAHGGRIRVMGGIVANSINPSLQGGDIIVGRDIETGLLAEATDVSGAKLLSNKGFVETSGQWLATYGTHVQAKDWLLDPTNITIAASGATGTVYSTNYVAGADSVILASSISSSLNLGTSVTIATSSSGASAGNISVNESILKTAGGDAVLTLKAHGNITVATNKIITSSAGKLNVVFNSDIDNSGEGVILMNAGTRITSNGGNISFVGGSLGTGYAQSASGVGVNLAGTNIDAGAGNILVNGKSGSAQGIILQGTNNITAGQYYMDGQSSSGAGVYQGSGTATFTSSANGINSLIQGTSQSGRGVFVQSGTLNFNANNGSSATFSSGKGEMRLGFSGGVVVNSNGNVTLGSKVIDGTNFFMQATVNAQSGSFTIVGKTATGNAVAMQDGGGVGSRIIGTNGAQITLDGESGSGVGVNLLPAGVANSITASGAGASITINGVSATGTGISNGSSTITNNNGGITMSGTSNGASGIGINHGAGAILASGNLILTGSAVGGNAIASAGTMTSTTGDIVLSGSANSATPISLSSNITAAGNITISGTAVTAGTSVNIASASTISSSGAGKAININGNSNIAHAGVISNNTSGGATASITMASSLGSVGGAGTIASNGISASGGGISINSATEGTLSGRISGSGSLTKLGAGVTSLTFNNTYTGQTYVNEGTLSLKATASSAQYGSGQFNIASGATLNFDVATGVNTGAYTNTIFAGNGVLSKTGGGSLVWNTTAATFNLGAGSLIDVQAGTLVGSSNSNESWTNNLSSLNIAAGATFSGSEGNIRVDALTGAGSLTTGWSSVGGIAVGVNGTTAGKYNPTSGTANFSGVISSTSGNTALTSLTKTGSGTQILTGANTYQGITSIAAGKLQIGNGSSVGTLGSGAVNISAGANLDFNRSDAFTVANTISGAGSVSQNGTGAGTTSNLTLTGDLSAETGVFNVNYGTLTFSAPTVSRKFNGSAININNGSTVRVTNPAGIFYSFGTNWNFDSVGGGTIDASPSVNFVMGHQTTSSNNTFNTNGGATNRIIGVYGGGINTDSVNSTTTFNVAPGSSSVGLDVSADLWNAGSIVKSGEGLMQLSGITPGKYTGAVAIQAGTLQVGDGNAKGYLGTGAVSVASEANLQFNRSDTLTVGNLISGAGTLTQVGSGTTILTANNTYSGTTTISAGVLQVGNGGTTGTLGTGDIVDNASLVFNRSNALSIQQMISGTGTLTQSGTGTTTLTESNTYTGTTTINKGILAVTGAAYGTSLYDIKSGAELNFDTSGTVRDYRSTTFTGGGTLSKTGWGTLRWGGSAATFNLSAGALIDVRRGTFVGGASSNEVWENNLSSLNVAAEGIFQGVESAVRVDALTGAGNVQIGYNGFNSGLTVGVNNTAAGLYNTTAGSASFTGTINNFQTNTNGTFNKVGTGTQILTGNNAYTGATNVNAGVLSITGTAYGTTSYDIKAGAELNFNTGLNVVDYTSTTFTGAGTLSKTGWGSVRWGTNSVATFNLSAGALIDVKEGSFWGTIGIDAGGDVWTNNQSSLNLASGTVFFAADGEVKVDALTGSGRAQIGSQLSASGLTVGVNNTAAGKYNLVAGSATFAGQIINYQTNTNGILTKAGAGTQILTGENNYSGATVISAGVLQIGNGGTSGSLGLGAVTDNASLVINKSSDLTIANLISGTGALTQQGTGTTTLTANNQYTGTTTISAGTLQIGNGGLTGSLGTGAVIDDGALVINRANTYLLSNVISGAGSFSQAGSGITILEADNSYQGNSVVSAGTLQVGNAGNTGRLGLGDVLLSNDSDLIFQRAAATTIANNISGEGSLAANIMGSSNQLVVSKAVNLTGGGSSFRNRW